ncbi:MAG: TonB-dependent receptor, partial [Bradyrhizobium sp.]
MWRGWGLGLAALSLLHVETSRAQSPANTDTLPPVTVQAPTSDPKPHRLQKRASRKQASPRAVASNTSPPAPRVTTGGSGVPNVASGPSGTPNMASQMTVSGEELNARPVTRPGEVLEATPGLIVTQHSGEGKANQY